MAIRSLLISLILLLFLPLIGRAGEHIKIPMTVEPPHGKKTVELSATLYKPDGEGPFPLVVINHGSPKNSNSKKKQVRFEQQSAEFVKRGFVAIIPMRRGYADSGGEFAESHGECYNANYYFSGIEASKDIKATVEFMVRQPYIDPARILIVGQSAGGFSSIAFGSLNVQGILGIINFAGGRGSNKERPDGVCSQENLISAISRFGETSRVPTLWIYTENDSYFSPSLAKMMFESYIINGGRGKLVLLPPFRNDGHFLFHRVEGIPLWSPLIDEFLNDIRMRPTLIQQ